jgi:hypothetical protein
VRGKMSKKKVGRAIVNNDLVMDRKKQVLHTDVMHIDGSRFHVMVCEPLNLTLQVYIEKESQSVLGAALKGQLELLYSRGFAPVRVHVDPQRAFYSLTTKFENVTIDVGGVANYVPKVDAKIS